MVDDLRHLGKRALAKLFEKTKTAFEDAFANGKSYEEVNSLYHSLKRVQDELNRRLIIKPQDNSTM